MRRISRMRAGCLAAGLLSVSLTGCWSLPGRSESRGPNQNIPRTNVNAPLPGVPAGGYPGAAAPPVTRVSGAPSGPAVTPGGPAYFQQGATGGGPSEMKPNATSNAPASKDIEPIAHTSPGDPLPPPEKLPLEAAPRELTPIQPISLQNSDRKLNFERKPPVIPLDDDDPLPQPKVRSGNELLGPPPQ